MVNIYHHYPSSNHFLLERILAHCEMYPNEPCIFRLGRNGEITGELTWDKLVESARHVAAFLSERNIKAGDRVILSLPNSFEFISAFIGLWWIGAIPVPVPEPSPKMKRNAHNERLLNVIANCKPKGILVINDSKRYILSADYFESVITNSQVWTWDAISATNNIKTQHLPHQNYKEKDGISFIQYTSGSTDKPKGVVVTHGMLRANCLGMGKACGMSLTDKVLNWIPLYHDMGLIGGLLGPNYFKAKVFLMETKLFLSNPYLWLKGISDHKITVSIGPNFAYNLCATSAGPNLPNLDLSSWRLAFTGSEPVWHNTITEFTKKFTKYGFNNTTFYPVYGMAEATLGIAFPSPGKPVITDTVLKYELIHENRTVPVSAQTDDSITFVSVGQCLPDHTLFIIDPTTNKKLGEREVGEICFSGPSVFPGYFRDVSEQQPQHSSPKMLYTGDIGYLAEGNLYVVDRVKDLIKIAGKSYYPSDIEKRLESIDGVRNGRVAVFEIPDHKYETGTIVIAVEISRHSIEKDIKNKIKLALYNFYKILPTSIVLSKQGFLPLTSSGKIKRQACREMFLSKTLIKSN